MSGIVGKIEGSEVGQTELKEDVDSTIADVPECWAMMRGGEIIVSIKAGYGNDTYQKILEKIETALKVGFLYEKRDNNTFVVIGKK